MFPAGACVFFTGISRLRPEDSGLLVEKRFLRDNDRYVLYLRKVEKHVGDNSDIKIKICWILWNVHRVVKFFFLIFSFFIILFIDS